MTARTSPWLAGFIIAIGVTAHAAPVPASDPAAAFKPTVTIRFAPLDQVLGDIRYTANLIARFAPSEKEAKEFTAATDEFVDKALGPDWRKAIDTTRPLFGYATIDANFPASTGAMVIPVKDAVEFSKLLAWLVNKVEDAPDGVQRFEFPGERDAEGKPVYGYVRFANQYAYVTYKNAATLALSRIPTPAQIVAGNPSSGISGRLYLDRMPDAFRQKAIVGVEQFKAMMTAPGGVNRDAMIGAIGVQMLFFGGPLFQLYPLAEPAVRDGQELVVDLGYDRTRLNLLFDLTMTPKAGSELSRLTAALKPATSLFPQMVGPDLAARGLIRGTIPEDIRKAIGFQIAAGLGQATQTDPVWGTLAAKIGTSLLPTLADGEIDFAAGLLGPSKAERYGVVGGIRLKDAAGVEKTLREAIGGLPKDAQSMFKWDSVTVNGTKVHQILPGDMAEPAKSLFGESTVHFAFRPDGVVFAFGDGAPGTIAAGLTAKPQVIAKSEIDVSGRRLLPLVTKVDAEAGKKFKAFLGTDLDRIPILDMAVEGGSTLKVRYGNGLTTLFPLVGLAAFRLAAPQPAQFAPVAAPVAPAKP